MAAGFLGQVINTFGQIAVVPLFLHFWTKRAYGEWLVITAVPNLLWSLEGGLGWLAINQMVLCSAVGDWKAANRWFQNIFVVQMVISALIILGGFFFIQGVDFLPMFDIKEMSRPDAEFVLMVMLFYMLLGWGIALARAPYFGAQLSARGTMLTNFWRLSDLIVICFVLVLHGHARLMAEGETLVAAIWVVLTCIDICRKCPEFRFYLSDVSWKSCKAVFRDGSPLFLAQAGNALFIQGYPLILSRTLGTLAVVNFSAIRTVTRVLLQFILILTQTASVELASSFATKKWDLYLRWVKILAVSVLAAGTVACVGLLYFGPTIISIWTHGKVLVTGPLLLLFGISVTLQAAWNMFVTLLYTANKHHLQCCLYFIITIIALIVGRFSIGYFGFGVVPIIMICADVVVLITTIALTVYYLREVKFTNLLVLFSPFFYWTKVKWAYAQTKNGNLYFWSPNR